MWIEEIKGKTMTVPIDEPAVPQLLQQADLLYPKILQKSAKETLYQVKSTIPSAMGKKWVRVLKTGQAPFFIQREKDLLRYFNKRSDRFAHFYEIRKVGLYYLIILDPIAKRDLAAQVAKAGPFSESEARMLLKSLISELEILHGVGLAHSHLQPQSIFITKDKKHAFLLNWSEVLPILSSYETERLSSGNQAYTAPERMNGIHDMRGDIYQLGCVLYFALTGKHIYRADKQAPLEQLYAHAFHSPRKINRLPIFWRQLIIWMTQKQPEKRPTLLDLRQWVEDFEVPKWVRETTLKPIRGWPVDLLAPLAEAHYYYANYKQACDLALKGQEDQAFKRFEDLAFKGYSRAAQKVAAYYLQGKFVAQSNLKAVQYYYQGFEKGNPYAALQLGHFFEQGRGVKQNLNQAYKLYRFAAMRGQIEAQKQLAQCYWKGIGVKADGKQARFWMSLAAYCGDLTAKRWLEQVRPKNDLVEVSQPA